MNNIITVAQLNRYVKNLFDENHLLQEVFIKGEISNFVNHYTSGHLYFSLKDSKATVKSVMFSSNAKFLKFTPENGMSVIVRATVSLYEKDGTYQLYVMDMQPDGIGSLAIAYEQLKNKLTDEGLFSAEKKKPLPLFPKNIAIITALKAAALQDILNILSRRYPIGNVRIYPVLVQGTSASNAIEKALNFVQNEKICDCIILARGGGSIEDLWAFNEEKTVRAVANCTIPIITGIGHETDFTLCDFASDMRGATPSECAELVATGINEIKLKMDKCEEILKKSVDAKIEYEKSVLSKYSAEFLESFLNNIYSKKENEIIQLEISLKKQMENIYTTKEKELSHGLTVLNSLNPLNVLERGYSITKTSDNKPMKNLKIGDEIISRTSEMTIKSTVNDIKIGGYYEEKA